MLFRNIQLTFIFLVLTACDNNVGGYSPANQIKEATPILDDRAESGGVSSSIPECWPQLSQSNMSAKIAYGCGNVSNLDSQAQQEVTSLIVALRYKLGSIWAPLCSAIPIKYDPIGNVTYLLSAAHCFSGGIKSTTQQITTENIKLNNYNSGVFTGVEALPMSGFNIAPTSRIKSVMM